MRLLSPRFRLIFFATALLVVPLHWGVSVLEAQELQTEDNHPLALRVPSGLSRLSSALRLGVPSDSVASIAVTMLEAKRNRWFESQWSSVLSKSLRNLEPSVGATTTLLSQDRERTREALPLPTDLANLADLQVDMNARLEGKLERSRNEICTQIQRTQFGSNCFSTWLPGIDFQVNLNSKGVVADRVFVDVKYDSQNQFDASNTMSLFYQGKPDETLHRLEIGNVSFEAPVSRFLTAGIPSNNYGVQAKGQIGPMHFSAILAQQKGNVSRDNVFTIGDRAVQQIERVIEDIQLETRRFFFTVDPREIEGYPNIDIMDNQEMRRAAASLPDSLRPSRVFVYRQLIGSQHQNPLGPQFSVRGARNPARQTYEVLRENVDYYLDPSMLWIALVRPLGLNNERLVVAYEVMVNGIPGRNINTGGTPDLQFSSEPQYANLLWEPELQPSDSAWFLREIKSVYRLGGEELRRETVNISIVTNASGDQELPPDASYGSTWLQLLGLARSTNSAQFDVDNRLWPRPNDPNIHATAGGNQKLFRDNFIVFPSTQPFSHKGLVRPTSNPSNDTLYSYPNEYLYSAQRPQSIFRMLASYESVSDGGEGGIALGTTQLRAGSERVELDGMVLQRGRDYSVSYETGHIMFNRPDTLFARERTVRVRYEENPLFEYAATPTSIFGFASRFPVDAGQFTFTAISQNQKSVSNRPALGYEPIGSVVAGLTGDLSWDAEPVSRMLERIGISKSDNRSVFSLQGEFAMSKPRPNSAGQAWLESFEGDAGVQLSLSSSAWYFSSKPLDVSLSGQLGNAFSLERSTSLAWQNTGLDRRGRSVVYTIDQIDPSARYTRGGLQPPEPVLFFTLYPQYALGALSFENSLQNGAPLPAWMSGGNSGLTPTGRRWRSVRTVLDPGGRDLSRVENLEFYALVYTEPGRESLNPLMVFDFGEISENSIAHAPDTLVLRNNPSIPGKIDSLWFGKRLQGYDRIDSERDEFSRAFNALTNDTGLPGSLVDSIVVIDSTAANAITEVRLNIPMCNGTSQNQLVLGDTRANCTVRNNRMDEEDIDQDGQLNMTDESARELESYKRFVVDLSDRNTWTRVGRCSRNAPVHAPSDSTEQCWVLVRMDWRSPTDSSGPQNDRRVRALRLSLLSHQDVSDSAYISSAIARLRLVGAPWLKRTDRPVTGISGDSASSLTGGYVIASVVGTLDSSAGIPYEPPPGIAELPEERQSGAEASRVQVNERSLRLLAGAAPGQIFKPFDRAEAYLRFPEGFKSFMGYGTLRLWMRGRGNGWGPNGELQGFVKIGRDEHNFYAYRTTVNTGESKNAWEPEVRVNLQKFQQLRARLESNYLHGSRDSISCTGTDLELILRSGLPRTGNIHRYAACEDGYIVHTTDPSVSPPNLAAVQELAVGFIRVDSIARNASAIMPNDTLELWIDDIRLSDVVDDAGFAGELGISLTAGDLMDFRASIRRRDPNFRQLGEVPGFISENGYSIGTTVHLDRVLPNALGIAAPLTIDYSGSDAEQLFLNNTDIRAEGIDNVRNPRAGRVTYVLSLRRKQKVMGHWYAPLLNGISLNASWGNSSNTTTLHTGKSSHYRMNFILDLTGDERTSHLLASPLGLLGFLGESFSNSSFVERLSSMPIRWNPYEFRFTSGVSNNENRNRSYLKAAVISEDSGRVSSSLDHVWMNTGALEFRPAAGVSARLDARQVLDLRDYSQFQGFSDSLDRLEAYDAAEVSFLGRSMGIERERSVVSAFRLEPRLSSWFRPRAEIATGFSMLTDPNARRLIRTNDTVGPSRLPKRLGAVQDMSGGFTFDAYSLLKVVPNNSQLLFGWLSILQPLDVMWVRTLDSNHDNIASIPGSAYQFGYGGIDMFRGVNGTLASSAGRTKRTIVTGGFNLPLSLSISTRAELGRTETWNRRVQENFQALIINEQNIWPDITLRWNWRPYKTFAFFSGLAVTAGYAINNQRTDVRDELGLFTNWGKAQAERIPVSASIAWDLWGPLTTSASLSRIVREDERPGAHTNSSSTDVSLGVSRVFRLPESMQLRSGLRTHLSWQRQGARSSVRNSSGQSLDPNVAFHDAILADNGREALSLTADTDISETLTFSLSGSKVVTFDRSYNRRFAQTTFSAILHLNFFGGALY